MLKKLAVLLLIPVLGCAASIERIYDKSEPKTVKIGVRLSDGRGGSGSGAFIDEYGTVLTCAHVVVHEGVKKIFVKMADGTVLKADVLSVDIDKDLAILVTTPPHKTPYYKLGNPVKRGQQVLLLGSPLGIQHSLSVGWVGNLLTSAEFGLRHMVVVHSAFTNPGNSGGPLIDMNGRLVGLGEGTLTLNPFVPAQGLAFAIGIDDIKSFLAGK